MAEPSVTTATVDSGASFQKLRHELGATSLGINAITLRPGQRNRVHIHVRQEEIYLVLEGELTLVVEGDPVKLTAGQLARLAPSVKRQITNTSPRPTTIIALGALGDHESRDALAWTTWDEEGEGRSPADVPLPDDLPIADA